MYRLCIDDLQCLTTLILGLVVNFSCTVYNFSNFLFTIVVCFCDAIIRFVKELHKMSPMETVPKYREIILITVCLYDVHRVTMSC